MIGSAAKLIWSEAFAVVHDLSMVSPRTPAREHLFHRCHIGIQTLGKGIKVGDQRCDDPHVEITVWPAVQRVLIDI